LTVRVLTYAEFYITCSITEKETPHFRMV